MSDPRAIHNPTGISQAAKRRLPYRPFCRPTGLHPNGQPALCAMLTDVGSERGEVVAGVPVEFLWSWQFPSEVRLMISGGRAEVALLAAWCFGLDRAWLRTEDSGFALSPKASLWKQISLDLHRDRGKLSIFEKARKSSVVAVQKTRQMENALLCASLLFNSPRSQH